MGLYIKKAHKPKGCLSCGYNDPACECARNCTCPLIEVPEHGRLIDADALYEKLRDELRFCRAGGHADTRIREMMVELQIAPTVIPKEGEETWKTL